MKNKINDLSQKTIIKNSKKNNIVKVKNLDTLTAAIMLEYFYNKENLIYHQNILNKNIKRFYIPKEIYINKNQIIKFSKPTLDINSKNYEYYEITVKKSDENNLIRVYIEAMKIFLNKYSPKLAKNYINKTKK